MTQYQRIEAFLLAAGKTGASYLQLQIACHTTCPWKRIAEMEHWGWQFKRREAAHGGRWITLVELVKAPAR